MKRTQRGFTLIELMIVVAIIGVLASIAVPQYQTYTARAQLTEAFSVASGYKTAMTEFYATNGRFPDDGAEIGFPADGETFVDMYLGDIDIFPASGNYNARVVMNMSNTAAKAIQGRQIVMEPIVSEGSINWSCRPTTGTGAKKIDTKYLPASCQDEK